jgi:hypothetical protein
MCACDHLLDRAGGKVYLDNTSVSTVLKKNLKEYRPIIELVYLYLKHGMVRVVALHMHLFQSIFYTYEFICLRSLT